MTFYFRAIAASFSLTLGLSACTSDYESTSDKCDSISNSPVAIGLNFTDPNVSPYIVQAQSTENTYQLYLEDIFQASEPGPSETLTDAETDAMAAFKALINDDTNFDLQYVQALGGAVEQATNPLDFIEALIASQDSNEVIGVFEEAKQQMANAIKADDDFCNYSNNNIRFVDTEANDRLFVEFNLSYSPFTRIVQQSILAVETQSDLSDIDARPNAPYIGFYQADADAFVKSGFSTPILRQAIFNSADTEQTLIIDDGWDNDLGQIEISTSNEFCLDENDEKTACEGGITTRAPVKSQCDGSDPELSDETGQNQVRVIDLTAEYSGLKRIRLETDYEAQEVRFYVSDYNEAILDSDGVTVIKDPTNCEKQAVLDELAEASPGEGVRLTVVEDENYDIRYDDNDEVIEPVPAFTFTGTSIPNRID